MNRPDGPAGILGDALLNVLGMALAVLLALLALLGLGVTIVALGLKGCE